MYLFTSFSLLTFGFYYIKYKRRNKIKINDINDFCTCINCHNKITIYLKNLANGIIKKDYVFTSNLNQN